MKELANQAITNIVQNSKSSGNNRTHKCGNSGKPMKQTSTTIKT